jgi:hypothetical protein
VSLGYRYGVGSLGCDCDGSGLGVVRGAGMFEANHMQGLKGLAALGALAALGDDISTDDPGTFTSTDTSSLPYLQDSTPLYEPGGPLSGGSYDWGSGVPSGAATTSGQPLSLAQISALISTTAGAANAVLKSTQSPYVLPGTNVIYNPATGQLANASYVGLTSGSLGLSLGSLSGMLPLLLIGGVILLVAGGRK